MPNETDQYKNEDLANEAVLRVESKEFFNQFAERHRDALTPQNAWELELVEDFTVNCWRKRRMRHLTVALSDHESDQFPDMHNVQTRAAELALNIRVSIGQSQIHEVLSRFETRYNRNASSALRLLSDLRKASGTKSETSSLFERSKELQ
jgi:hypothetical protein